MGGDVIANIHYLTETKDGRPAETDLRPTHPWSIPNFGQAPSRVTIHDLRDKEDLFTLDKNGFEIIKFESGFQKEFDPNGEAQQECYNEMANELQKHLGASRVVFYNHVFRYRGRPLNDDQGDGSHRNPIFYPHVDIDGEGVQKKLEIVMGLEEANQIKQKRYQVINIWRPVGPNPITNKPLTICDYASIDLEKDVHPLKAIGSYNTATAYCMACSSPDTHKWYYLSRMQSNEIFLFKMFDSKEDVAQFAFHTGFLHENEPPSDAVEISIEMRGFVFYD